jgi:hypothetical protein
MRKLPNYKKIIKKLRAKLAKAEETQFHYMTDHTPNTLKFDCDRCGRHITVTFHLSAVTGL